MNRLFPDRECSRCGGKCLLHTGKDSRQEASMVEQEKMAAIGKLAAGITHELNTPLTYVRGNLETLIRYQSLLASYLEELAASGCGDKLLLQKIESISRAMEDMSRTTLVGTDRLMNIVRSMRGFIQKNISQKRFTNVFTPLFDAITLTWNRVKHAGGMEINGWRYTPDDARGFIDRNRIKLACDSQRICQLFVILINNSVDAWNSSGRRGQLLITIRMERKGREMLCRFCDNAGGMDSQMEENVFEPFVSGNLTPGGVGLGMAIARQITREHNGGIILENSEGQGVCWHITLADRE